MLWHAILTIRAIVYTWAFVWAPNVYEFVCVYVGQIDVLTGYDSVPGEVN